MRWKIRKAKIDEELRTTLEQYGVAVMQQILATGGVFIYRNATTSVLHFAQYLFQACGRAPQADTNVGVLLRRKCEVELPLEPRRDFAG